MDVPDACADALSCACFAEEACGTAECTDGAGGASVTCADAPECVAGETFDAPDGCNTCTCPASGKKSEAPCTEMGCIYDPCAGKSCGDVCSICDPADPDCVAPAVLTVCDAAGACTMENPVCSEEVQCTGAAEPTFPQPDKTCATADDCVVVLHQINCCGTMVALAINADDQAEFADNEALCQSQFPACGCPTLPTQADDGQTGWALDDFGAQCVDGQCTSIVVPVAGEACQTEGAGDWSETCSGDDLLFCVCDEWDADTCPTGVGTWTKQGILCTCQEWFAGSCPIE